MAYLATLEGDGTITIDDLFDVNDYLGTKIFGVDLWNRIKEKVCSMATEAMEDPTFYCVKNIRFRATPSALGQKIMGYNDRLGVCAMGSQTWCSLKGEIESELLGFSNPLNSLKKAGEWIADKASDILSVPGKLATSFVKKGLDTPEQVMNYLTKKSPLKYLPGSMAYSYIDDNVTEKIRDTAAENVQNTIDITNMFYNKLADKTGLKYIPNAQLLTSTAKTLEKSGAATPGTADVYDSPEEVAAKKRAKWQAIAQAQKEAAAAGQKNATAAYAGEKAAKEAIAAQEAYDAQQAVLEETQQDLNVMEQRVTSKYAPIVMAGCFGLLAIALLKK